MSGPERIVDASAVLAYLLGEPGGERVASALSRGGGMSAVNLCEVLSKIEDKGWPEDPEALHRFRLVLGAFEILPFDEPEAMVAAELRRSTRKLLSLGDRCCVATARTHKLPVLTAERGWGDLELGVVVELIR